MSEQSRSFTQQATQALQDGNFTAALEFADQALALDPNDDDAFVLKGIALAQSNQPDAATQAFRGAISANPQNSKAYYNLATHLYQLNQRAEAMAMAQEALRLEPSHAAARELMTLLEQEQGGSAQRPEGPAATTQQVQSPYVRPGYDQAAPGAVAFVDKMGKTWTTIGWVLSLLSLGLFIWAMSTTVPIMMEAFQNPENAKNLSEKMQASLGPMYYVLSILGWVVRVGSVGWSVMDLVNRRGNYVWLVGLIPCSCCGFEWLILPIYLLTGRK